jgi:hypothetical protein
VDKTRREGPRIGPSGSCSGTGRASCVQGLVIPRSSRPSASVSPSVDSLLSAQFHLGEIDRRLRGDARHTHSAHDARPQSSTCHLRPAQLVPNALLSHRHYWGLVPVSTLDKAVPGVPGCQFPLQSRTSARFTAAAATGIDPTAVEDERPIHSSCSHRDRSIDGEQFFGHFHRSPRRRLEQAERAD